LAIAKEFDLLYNCVLKFKTKIKMSKKGSEVREVRSSERLVSEAERDFGFNAKVMREGKYKRLELFGTIRDVLNSKGERVKEQTEEEVANLIIDQIISSDLNHSLVSSELAKNVLSLPYDESDSNIQSLYQQIVDFRKAVENKKGTYSFSDRFGSKSGERKRLYKFEKFLEKMEVYVKLFKKMSKKTRMDIDNPKRGEVPYTRAQKKLLKKKNQIRKDVSAMNKKLEVIWKKKKKEDEKEGKGPVSMQESLQDNVIPLAIAEKKNKDDAVSNETPKEGGDDVVA